MKIKKDTEINLMKYVDNIPVFSTPDKKCYAVIKRKNHIETVALHSRDFKRYLKNKIFSRRNKFPSNNQLTDIIDRLEYKAYSQRIEKNTHIRIANIKDKIILDLCNQAGRVVIINKEGWKIENNSYINFINPRGMLALPTPTKCNSRKVFRKLRKFINTDKNSFKLIISWLLGALAGKGPYPILVLLGEPGSGKSTVMEMLRSLIDPSSVPLRSLPRNERDLMITAEKNLVLAYDNVSAIPKWLSDAFCRISTGGGLSTRELYSDDGEILFNVERPIILNGISDVVRKNDLSDRAITVVMRTIKDTKRKPKDEFMENFNAEKPKFIGALCDGVSEALKNVNDVNLEQYPRMADFLKWVVAAENAVYKKSGKLEAAYMKNIKNMSATLVDSDYVGIAIKKLLKDNNGDWMGTPSGLLDKLEDCLPEDKKETILHDNTWPKAPNALSSRLSEIAPDLRKIGIEYVKGRRKSHGRFIRLKWQKSKK